MTESLHGNKKRIELSSTVKNQILFTPHSLLQLARTSEHQNMKRKFYFDQVSQDPLSPLTHLHDPLANLLLERGESVGFIVASTSSASSSIDRFNSESLDTLVNYLEEYDNDVSEKGPIAISMGFVLFAPFLTTISRFAFTDSKLEDLNSERYRKIIAF